MGSFTSYFAIVTLTLAAGITSERALADESAPRDSSPGATVVVVRCSPPTDIQVSSTNVVVQCGTPSDNHSIPRHQKPRRYVEPIDGMAPPPGYEKSSRVSAGTIGAGAAIFGATHLISAMMGGFGGIYDGTLLPAVIPLVGDFYVAAKVRDHGWQAAWAALGLFQNAGLAELIIGATVRRPVWKLRDTSIRPDVVVSSSGVGIRMSF
jgi:hypothetical protein